METKYYYRSGGVSFLGVLFLVFLVLKLTHVINWSWWWITAPLWGPFAIATVIVFFVLTGILIASLISKK